jgi:hypothetical protein
LLELCIVSSTYLNAVVGAAQMVNFEAPRTWRRAYPSRRPARRRPRS